MSALSEILISVSLIGTLLLFIYSFWKDRNRTRLGLQLLLLGGLVIVLHGIFEFPKTLLNPESVTISKGPGDKVDWPIYVLAYVAMVAGMLCNYLYARFSTTSTQRARFDWGSFFAPIFVSPIIFVPLCGTLSGGDQTETSRYMIFLIAFENGFFFKGYFDLAREVELPWVSALIGVKSRPRSTRLVV
jgi:hypothetical protein